MVALLGAVDGEASEKDDGNRVGHPPPETRRRALGPKGAHRQRVEPDHRAFSAQHRGGGGPGGGGHARRAPQPLVELGDARVELVELVGVGERLDGPERLDASRRGEGASLPRVAAKSRHRLSRPVERGDEPLERLGTHVDAFCPLDDLASSLGGRGQHETGERLARQFSGGPKDAHLALADPHVDPLPTGGLHSAHGLSAPTWYVRVTVVGDGPAKPAPAVSSVRPPARRG